MLERLSGLVMMISLFFRKLLTGRNDNTVNIESRLQNRLLDLVKADLMPRWIYDAIRPTGSQKPRIYGMPKTHKESTPLRPYTVYDRFVLS